MWIGDAVTGTNWGCDVGRFVKTGDEEATLVEGTAWGILVGALLLSGNVYGRLVLYGCGETVLVLWVRAGAIEDIGKD